MGNSITVSSNVVQNIANSAIQTSIGRCRIECDQDMTGNTIIINGGNVGNINLQQICVVKDSKCTINSSIESIVDNILESSIDQSAFMTNPIIPQMTQNNTKLLSNVEQNITNQLQQLISSTCVIETTQKMNNNFIYVGNATAGNINFVQNSTLSNVECIIDNMAKSESYNKEVSDVKQKATTVDCLTMFGMVIALVLGLIIIVMLIFLLKIGLNIVPGGGGGGGTVTIKS